METLWTIIFVILIGLWVVNRFVSATQRAKGERFCVECHARLKFVGVGSAGTAGMQRSGFATTCSKCGAKQPWA
jgi:nitrate/TMAO reductase-like tetraheme cytochrome c subunit